VTGKADGDEDDRDDEGGEGQEVGQALVEVGENVAVEIRALRQQVD
jgi:hypothetical protein